MFCPKCSQEQSSDEMRFCSRCGFQLSGVSELLLTGGESLISPPKNSGIISYLRQKNALAGAKIMFFSLCLLPIAVGIGIAVNGPAPLLAAVIPFFIGLVYMLYGLAFRNQSSEARPNHTPIISSVPPRSYTAPLGLAESDEFMPLPPPSVTDQTTKLLHNWELKNK